MVHFEKFNFAKDVFYIHFEALSLNIISYELLSNRKIRILRY
jgi:hypothetical protein